MLRSMSQELYIIWLSFMVQMCKMMVSPGIFFNFKILIFQVVRELKGKKWPNMTKISICRTLCFRNHQIGRAGGEGAVLKGQKMTQNDKKFCLPHSVSQEPYIIWLWFLVHMCKMMISPANFCIFQNFEFWSFGGIKGQILP